MVKNWHRNAPAKKAGETPKPKAWAKAAPAPLQAPAPRFDAWSQNDDGTVIPRDFRCVEDPAAGLRRMLSIWAKPAPRVIAPKPAPIIPRPNAGNAIDPTKCIAAGGRRRCMDCRCGLPSPKNVVAETWENSGYSRGSKSGHGKP
jgi:hypothetical protein